MTLGNQILMFQERNVKCFYINTPRLTKDQRVSKCLEYPRVNNAREVIPAALGRSLTTNVYFLTIVRLSTGYCCIIHVSPVLSIYSHCNQSLKSPERECAVKYLYLYLY